MASKPQPKQFYTNRTKKEGKKRWNLFKSIRKGNVTTGGISHVLQPIPGTK
jgi:hypothetical protein